MTSQWMMAVNALIFICFAGFHDPSLLFWLRIFPLYALPIALLIGVLSWAVFESIGKVLQSRSTLNLPSVLAASTLVSMVTAFAIPLRLPTNILLEDYAALFVTCAGALQLMALIWWFSYSTRHKVAA